MNQRIFIIVGLAVLLFAAYILYFRQKEYFTQQLSEEYKPIVRLPEPELPERIVAASGPSAPSQRSLEGPVRIPEPVQNDPAADNYTPSNFEDDNRAPERSFGPARLPTDTSLSVMAGNASESVNPTKPNVYQFTPEQIHTGGEFMDGIVANDTMEPTNFSSF
jgi:hypothetical protein